MTTAHSGLTSRAKVGRTYCCPDSHHAACQHRRAIISRRAQRRYSLRGALGSGLLLSPNMTTSCAAAVLGGYCRRLPHVRCSGCMTSQSSVRRCQPAQHATCSLTCRPHTAASSTAAAVHPQQPPHWLQPPQQRRQWRQRQQLQQPQAHTVHCHQQQHCLLHSRPRQQQRRRHRLGLLLWAASLRTFSSWRRSLRQATAGGCGRRQLQLWSSWRPTTPLHAGAF